MHTRLPTGAEPVWAIALKLNVPGFWTKFTLLSPWPTQLRISGSAPGPYLVLYQATCKEMYMGMDVI